VLLVDELVCVERWSLIGHVVVGVSSSSGSGSMCWRGFGLGRFFLAFGWRKSVRWA
jgi:hypothetical protein